MPKDVERLCLEESGQKYVINLTELGQFSGEQILKNYARTVVLQRILYVFGPLRGWLG